MAGLAPDFVSPIRATLAARIGGNQPHCAPSLQRAEKRPNIHVRLGAIWGILGKYFFGASLCSIPYVTLMLSKGLCTFLELLQLKFKTVIG
jgi:hypothetical protein